MDSGNTRQFTITRLSDLKENLRLIRQRGYAVDHQELERGLSGVAAPVLSRARTSHRGRGDCGTHPAISRKRIGAKGQFG